MISRTFSLVKWRLASTSSAAFPNLLAFLIPSPELINLKILGSRFSVSTLVFALLALVLTTSQSKAQAPTPDFTWNNFVSVGTQWSVVTNWVGGVAPTSNIDRILGFGSSPLQNSGGYTTTNASGAFDVNALVFNSFGSPTGAVVVTNTLTTDTINFNTSSTGTAPSIWQMGSGRVSFRHAVLNSFGITLVGGVPGTTLNIRGTGLGDLYLDTGITQTGAGQSRILINQTGTRAFNSGSVIRLGGSNSNFTGGVNLTAGNLMLSNVLNTTGAINQTASVAATVINSLGSGTLTVNGGSLQFDSLSISSGASPTGITGTLQVNNAISLISPLTLTGFAPATAPSGNIVGIFNGNISGEGGLLFAPTNGTLVYGFTGSNSFSGTVNITPVGNTVATALVGTANVSTGTFAGATGFIITGNSSLSLNNVFGALTRLNTVFAPTLTLNRGNFNLLGNPTVNVAETFASLTVNGTGSLTIQSGSGTVGSSTLTFGSLNRGADGRGALSITAQNMGIGTGAGEGILVFTTNPGGAIGGAGGAGTTTRTILPYAIANSQNNFAGISGTLSVAGTTLNTTFNSGGSTTNLGLVRYDTSTSRVVPLNLATEYASNLFQTGITTPAANMRLASTSTLPLAFGGAGIDSPTTINALVLDTNTAAAVQVGVSVGGTGTITLGSGVILVASNGNTGTGTINIPSLINVGGISLGSTTGYLHTNSSVIINAPITGSNGLVKNLGGSAQLNGINTFTGGLNIGLGTVIFSSDANLGAANQPITLNSGLTTALQFLPNIPFSAGNQLNVTVNRPITVGVSGTVVNVGLASSNLNFSGVVTGAGQFFKGGAGILTLSNTNTTTGPVVIGAGTLAVANDAAMGTSNVILAGGTFQPLSSFTTNRDFLQTSGSTFFTGGQNITMTGNLTSQFAATFLKDGTGDLTLTAANAFTGTYQNGTSAPTVRGTLLSASAPNSGRTILSGPNGSLNKATQINILGGGEIVLDNSGVVANINNNRLGQVSVSFAGNLTLIGNANGPVNQAIGALSFFPSGNAPFGGTITLDQPTSAGGQSTTLTALSISANTTVATVFLRGTNLGGVSGDRTSVVIATAPTLINSILPSFVGATSSTGEATTFLTTSVITNAAPNVSQSAIVPFAGYAPGVGALGVGGASNTYDITAAATFTGGSSANALRLSAGGSVDVSAGNTLTLSAGAILATGGANGGISNGTVAFGAQVGRVTVNSDSNLTMSSLLTGSAGFVKSGAGILTLSAASTALSGSIALTAGTITYGVTNALPVGSLVFLNSGTTLDLNNTASTLGTIQGFGNLTLGSAGLTLSSTTVPGIFFGGTITGTGPLVKTNTNTVTFSGNNSTFSGQVSILNGTLTTQTNTGLGTGNILLGDTSGTNQALLTLGATVTSFANNITVQAGGSTTSRHTITAPTGVATISSNIAINNTLNSYTSGGFTATGVGLQISGASGAAGGSITQTGVISGAGGLLVFSGNWAFNGNNNYSGGTTFDTTTSSTAGLGIDSTPTTGTVTSGPFGTGPISFTTGFGINLRADGGARTIANRVNLSATGGYFGVVGTNDLTLNGAFDFQGSTVVQNLHIMNTATTTIGGPIQNGTAGFNKNGPGTLVISGTNTYSGLTTVNAGKLVVTSNVPGAATVNSGAIIGGTGTVTGALTVTTGAIVAPGNSSGTLNVNGASTVAGIYAFELSAVGTPGAGLNSGASSPTLPHINHDVLAVNNTLNLTGSTVTITSLGSTGFNNTQSYSWTIATSTGLTGTPTLGTVNGTDFQAAVTSGGSFSIGTSGNFMVLNFTPVPEPATVLSIGAGIMGLAGYIRRRRQNRKADMEMAA